MYESYYGLSSKPFQLTPDPEFFYASKLHKRAMSYLQYGLSQAEGFIVITGDIGTGKTTIANSLLKDIEADIHAEIHSRASAGRYEFNFFGRQSNCRQQDSGFIADATRQQRHKQGDANAGSKIHKLDLALLDYEQRCHQ